ncbi:MAG: ATP-binding protein [Sphingobacteriales bacterium]|nr:ATP-binding protein [Sphingobacteriales bacterium]
MYQSTTRYFNTSGPNNPKKHYTLLRSELIKKGIRKVQDDRYFTIWAPRQTGKSTYFRLLADALRQDDYLVSHINVEGWSESPEEFLCQQINECLLIDTGISIQAKRFDDLFAALTRLPKKMVFIIDEIEQLNPAVFNRFFHTIRNCYHRREDHALKSVILVGVSNITGLIQDNASPFNIADNFDVPYFTCKEVHELLEQHETESGQLFAEGVKDQIFHITAGQPGLVNGSGLLKPSNTPTYLFNLRSLFGGRKLVFVRGYRQKRVECYQQSQASAKFVEKLLFNEMPQKFKIDDEAIRYLHINGLLKKNQEGNIEFWVPLYKKRLQQYFYPARNGEAEAIQENIVVKHYFSSNGQLLIDKIIRDYQTYAARRGFRYFIERDASGNPKGLREAALMYSFETYIQSFLEVVQGKSYLEAHVALGRSDLIVNIRGQEFVVEGKLFHNITQFENGKPQLAYYVKSLGLTQGVYLVSVKSTVTNPEVQEATETMDGVTITTYIVRYDVDKDFG